MAGFTRGLMIRFAYIMDKGVLEGIGIVERCNNGDGGGDVDLTEAALLQIGLVTTTTFRLPPMLLVLAALGVRWAGQDLLLDPGDYFIPQAPLCLLVMGTGSRRPTSSSMPLNLEICRRLPHQLEQMSTASCPAKLKAKVRALHQRYLY